MVLQAVTILKILNCLFIMVAGHFAQMTFHTSLLAQVLDCLHNSWGSFRTIIISEKHQYKRYTD